MTRDQPEKSGERH